MNVDEAFRRIMESGRMPENAAEDSAQEDILGSLSDTSTEAEPESSVTVSEENGVQIPDNMDIQSESFSKPAKPAAELLDLSAINRISRFNYDPVDNRSQIAEEYRILRTRLQIVNPGRNSVMITSCRHGEGKSSTSMNLSLFMAKRKEKKILLADFDLRRPRLSKFFNHKQEPDFVDVIRHRAKIEDAITYSEQDNLYLMTPRREYSNATEILESNLFPQLLDRLHETFDFIIMDSCPCLSTADPMVIGPHAGGALMVVRARQTQRESLEHAVMAMKEHNIPTLGIILTFVRYFIPHYFYRYQYYHDSDYYYHYQNKKGTKEG